MGNLTSSMINLYVQVEASSSTAGPLLAGILVGLAHIIVIGIISCCTCDGCKKKSEQDVAKKSNDEKKCKKCCAKFSEWLFKVCKLYVTTIFSHTVAKKVIGYQTSGQQTTPQDSSEDLDRKKNEEVVLFAGLKPADTYNCCGCGCNPSCWAISYFIVMLLWAAWFASIVMLDNLIYSKLTRCADVNTRDDTITCFYISNRSQANCLEISERGQTADVICYALQRGRLFTAIGIASGVWRFFTSVAHLAFTLLVRIGRKCLSWDSCEKTCSCCDVTRRKWSLIVSLVLLISFCVVLLVVLPLLFLLHPRIVNTGWNIFYGHQPIRWIQYIMLFFLAICFLIFSQSLALCFENTPRYTDMVSPV